MPLRNEALRFAAMTPLSITDDQRFISFLTIDGEKSGE
jgi:hypothetical protein